MTDGEHICAEVALSLLRWMPAHWTVVDTAAHYLAVVPAADDRVLGIERVECQEGTLWQHLR